MPTTTQYLSISEVAARLGRPVSTIHNWRARGREDFPQPDVRVGTTAGWSAAAIDHFITEHLADDVQVCIDVDAAGADFLVLNNHAAQLMAIGAARLKESGIDRASALLGSGDTSPGGRYMAAGVRIVEILGALEGELAREMAASLTPGEELILPQRPMATATAVPDPRDLGLDNAAIRPVIDNLRKRNLRTVRALPLYRELDSILTTIDTLVESDLSQLSNANGKTRP